MSKHLQSYLCSRDVWKCVFKLMGVCDIDYLVLCLYLVIMYNRELKSWDLKWKATILYLFEAKCTHVKVETTHKKDEAELILAQEQVAKMHNDTKESDKLRLKKRV